MANSGAADGMELLKVVYQKMHGHLEATHSGKPQKVTHALDPKEVLAQIPEASQLGMEPHDAVTVAQVIDKVLQLSVNTSSKKFCNQLYAEPDPVGLAAQMLTSMANCSMATFEMTPVFSTCERHLVRQLLRKVGWEQGEGIFCPGGSACNHLAMLVARNTHQPSSKHAGLVTGTQQLVAFASDNCPYSVTKGANLIGIGQGKDGPVIVATDDHGAMKPDALRAAVEEAPAAGKQPFLVVATAGTTVRGAFDPIDAIADVCEEAGMWLHVDGALGGSLVMSDTHRHHLSGFDRADSLTWDAHKMLGVPLQCAVLLMRGNGLESAASASGLYLFKIPTLQEIASLGQDEFGTLQSELAQQLENSGNSTLQCGRLPDSFKWWLMWYVHGEEWFEARVDRLQQLRLHFLQKLEKSPVLHLAAPADGQLNVLFYALPAHLLTAEGGPDLSNEEATLMVGAASQTVRTILLKNSHWMINYQSTNGAAAPCLRMVFLNPALTEGDIDELVEELSSIVQNHLRRKPETSVEMRKPSQAKRAGIRFRLLTDAVDHWSRQSPNSSAVADSEGHLTYGELNAMAKTLAATLISRPGQTLPIWVRRGRLAVVAVIAALHRGCTWLMIDESLPTGRVKYLLEESGGSEVLVDEEVPRTLLPALMVAKRIELSSLASLPAAAARLDVPGGAAGEDPYAYQVFTSGSTGQPKSVLITQQQLTRLCEVFIEQFPLRLVPGDVCMALIGYAWDMHALDMWIPLLQGAETFILTEAERLNGARVADLMAQLQPKFCQMTPSFYKMVLKAGWEGDGTVEGLTALSSGEPMEKSLAKQLLSRCKALVNFYGLTEATIFQCFEVLRPQVGGDVDVNCGTFCYPEDYGRMYLLNDQRQPVDPGEVGEVAFAGAMLPRSGYLNSPDLNAIKFIPNPTGWICEAASDPIRRSSVMLVGDRGYLRPDGKLMLMGRLDDMVKVHGGSRVDTREVEQTIKSICAELVSDCVVVPAKRRDDTVLAAYWQPTPAAQTMEAEFRLKPDDGPAEEDLWEEIYDEAYAKKDAETMQCEFAQMSPVDLITNWSAYISSYTGKLWPREVIEYWLNSTVDRFLDSKPKRILEHGCGNGMLLFRAALQPSVEEVWGCDLSGEATAYVEQVMQSPHFKDIATKVKALHRPADNFEGMPKDHFDLIVMSAMIMYFPSMDYVSNVLRKCSAALRDGGVVYIGDCRSLEHQQLFHTDVTLYNAVEDVTVGDFQQACRDRNGKEKELLISPAYFYAHAHLLPGCFDHVVCTLRRGYDCPEGQPIQPGAPCEMTRWRYDVWLYKGANKAGRAPPQVRSVQYVGPDAVDEAITAALRGEATLVSGIPNPRVLDACGAEELARSGPPGRPMRELRQEIARWRESLPPALCPEALLQRCEAMSGVYVQTMFHRDCPHTYDAVLRPRQGGRTPVRPPNGRSGEELSGLADWGRSLIEVPASLEWGELTGQCDTAPRDLEAYGNKRKFEPVHTAILQRLSSELPRTMLPQMLVQVEGFPLGPTGKKDKKRLPAIVFSKDRTSEFVELETATERTIGQMWQDLFGVEQVGALDKWDELGGHSLLAGRVIALIRQELSVDCTMQDIFNHPTPRSLAQVLDTKVPSTQAAKGDAPVAERAEKAAESGETEVLVEDVSIPLGAVSLAGRLWRPAGAEPMEPMMAVVDFAPYPFTYMTATADSMIFPQLVELGRGGTCALRVAARGFDGSGGVCGDPYDLKAMRDDYLAVLKWVEKQAWCNGKIILHGLSWAGTACLCVATSELCPGSVKAACIYAGNDDLYNGDVFFQGGLPLTSSYNWAMQFMLYMTRAPTSALDREAWLARGSALTEDLAAKYLGLNDPAATYWNEVTARGRYSELRCPVLCATGHFGGYSDTVLRLVQDVRHVSVRGLVGPWTHQYPHLSTSGPLGDWVAEVHAWGTAQDVDRAPKSELFAYVMDAAPVGPAIPASVAGRWVRCGHDTSDSEESPTKEWVRCGDDRSDSLESVAPKVVDESTPFDIRLKDLAVEATWDLCGASGGEWFSWGMGDDFAGEQRHDDELSTCVDGEPLARDVTLVGCPTLCARKPVGEDYQGMLAVRLLAVAPDGSSRRLSWGVQSIQGAIGESTVKVSLRFLAVSVPSGHRLRVAFSLDYFPMFIPIPRAQASDQRLQLSSVSFCVPATAIRDHPMPLPGIYGAKVGVALKRLRQPQQTFESSPFAFHSVHDDGAVAVETGAGLVRVTTRCRMEAKVDPLTHEVVMRVHGRSALNHTGDGTLRATSIVGELQTHAMDPGSCGKVRDVPAATLKLTVEMHEDGQLLKRQVFNSRLESLLPNSLPGFQELLGA